MEGYVALIAGVSSALVSVTTIFGKIWYDGYKARRDGDRDDKKVDAEVRKSTAEAKIAERKADVDADERIYDRYEKILSGMDARLELERKRCSEDIQRMEVRFASLEKRNDECEKSNQFLKDQHEEIRKENRTLKDQHNELREENRRLQDKVGIIERKATNLERRSDENKSRLDTLESKTTNGGSN